MTEGTRPLRALVSIVFCASMLVGMLVIVPAHSRAYSNDAWIRGTVADGINPIPNAYIKLMIIAGNEQDINYTWTDATGHYVMDVVGGLSYVVFAANRSYYMALNLVDVAPGQTAYCNFTLTHITQATDVTVEGYVKDKLGSPVTSGHVLGIVMDPSGSNTPHYANVTTADPSGHFQVNVTPGPVGGGATAMDLPGYPMAQNITPSPLLAGHTYWFNITVLPRTYNDNAVIHGYVKDTLGAPLASALVQVDTTYSGGGSKNYTLTDSTGYYQLGIRNGTGSIMITKAGYTLCMDQSLVVAPGEVKAIDCKLLKTDAVVRGNVIDSRTGLPIGLARVILTDGKGTIAMAMTNSSGAYVLGAFSGTGLTIFAQQNGYGTYMTTISIAPGDTKIMDFALSPTDAWLVGRITDFFTGAPIAGASISALSQSYEAYGSSNATGYYNVSVVHGNYSVHVRASNYRDNSSDVSVGHSMVVAHDVALLPQVLPTTTVFSGYVNDSVLGTGIANAQVRVGISGGSYSNLTFADSTGHFQMSIPPMPLVCIVTATDHAPYIGEVNATGKSVYTSTFILQPDHYAPNVTYSQAPTGNVSTLNPSVIDVTVTESDLQQMALGQFMYWHRAGNGWGDYYAVEWASVSFDPLSPASGLSYTKVGSTYVVHEVWAANSTGGWLGNSTSQAYVMATYAAWGSQQFYMLRGYYSNATITTPQLGTALFDGLTGKFARFVFDQSWMYPAIVGTGAGGVFGAQVVVIAVNESNPTSFVGVGPAAIGNWTLTNLSLRISLAVPSGEYRTLFFAGDFASHRNMTLTKVTVDNEPPVANAGSNATVTVGTNHTLNGTLSSDNVGIVNYTWTFQDGGARTLYGPEPTYRFGHMGTFVITLNVSDAALHHATATVTIYVVDNVPPVANAGQNQTAVVGTAVTLNGSASTDNVGIVNYTWAVQGAAVALYGETQSYTFTAVGKYNVTLTVRDAAGNIGTDTIVVTVNAPADTIPPIANAGANQSVKVGAIVIFDGSSSYDNSGHIANYTWSFMYNGTLVKLYGASPTFKFGKAGDYTVTLTVRDDAGLTGTAQVVISVASETSSNALIMYAVAGAAVVAALLIGLVLVMRRGRSGGSKSPSNGSEEEEVEGPEPEDPGPPQD